MPTRQSRAPSPRKPQSPSLASQAFAICAPGLEPIVARELKDLGISGIRVDVGGVSFDASDSFVQRANLHLRVASRVVVRVAEFKALAFHELERLARNVRWATFLAPKTPVRLRVTCRKSKLYHSDAVAQRVAGAIKHATGSPLLSDVSDDGADETTTRAQLFVVRFDRDICTISADTSGELLHRRGYRQAIAKAPLRETLAAAILLAAEWTGDSALIDPLCGSGTICIEGALLSRRIPPGAHRTFAFMDWPGFSRQQWDALRAEALEKVRPAPASIRGSDRDAGAIAAAISNAERAGVSADIEFTKQAMSSLARSANDGILATNPPYGLRVGERAPLRDLYARLGQAARKELGGWTFSLLGADAVLERQIGLDLTPVVHTSNGGIPVRVLTGKIP